MPTLSLSPFQLFSWTKIKIHSVSLQNGPLFYYPFLGLLALLYALGYYPVGGAMSWDVPLEALLLVNMHFSTLQSVFYIFLSKVESSWVFFCGVHYYSESNTCCDWILLYLNLVSQSVSITCWIFFHYLNYCSVQSGVNSCSYVKVRHAYENI